MGQHLLKSVLTGALLVSASLLLVGGTVALADDLQADPTKPVLDDSSLKPALQGEPTPPTATSNPQAEKIRKDRFLAYRMAKNRFLANAAAANPAIVAAICAHPGPANVLAKHRQLDKIADADHYLCRRLTRWKRSSRTLVKNTRALHVITLDPEGIYYAIERSPVYARYLARQTLFNEMVVENPDLGKVMANHTR